MGTRGRKRGVKLKKMKEGEIGIKSKKRKREERAREVTFRKTTTFC